MTAVKAFQTWCTQQGVVAHADIRQTPSSGYGLFATKPVTDKDTPIIHIPQALIITAARAMETNAHLGALACTNERLCLRLFLLFEKYGPTTSFWKPYIDILPSLDAFRNHGLMIEDSVLAGTSLGMAVRAKRAALMREWEYVQSLCASYDWFATLKVEDWFWADMCFWSRVVSLHDDQMALIPFFDFANHSQEPTIRWQRPTKDGMDLVLFDAPVDIDTELTLSYGEKPNQELLFLHGFTLADNKQPARVTLSAVPFLHGRDDVLAWLPHHTLTLLHSPDSDLPSQHKLASTGWTYDSVAIMYMVSLTPDDGLAIHDDNVYLGQDAIHSLSELVDKVAELNHFAVIQLRAVMLLLDALETHAAILTDQEQQQQHHLSEHIQRYKMEELDMLNQGIEALSVLRDELATDEAVQAFLAAQED